MKYVLIFLVFFVSVSCEEQIGSPSEENKAVDLSPSIENISLVVLGTIQDAGSPHIACKKTCCAGLFENPDPKRQVVSLGIIDPTNEKKYLIEATPDISRQTKTLKQLGNFKTELPDGIFITHAHIGHYTGLMYLGKEATNAKNIPVYAMPRMKQFLETNGPWGQLVSTENIVITEMKAEQPVLLSPKLSVTPILVPHRDEYSETVGYRIEGPNKTALFIPDIDKWEKWETSITELIKKVDYAFLDATFYDGEEINTRDISEIPHPFIIESIAKFKTLPSEEKNKIYFIHFNHTNPVINANSEAYKTVETNGFHVATYKDIFPL